MDFTLEKKYTCEGDARTTNPIVTLTNVPEGTAFLKFKMVDWDYAPANHGSETLPYTGPVLTHGALKSYWGPCPPRGPHRYEMTFEALNAGQTLVLGSGAAMRYYPNKSSSKAPEPAKPFSSAEFEKMMALMDGADITYERIGYYTRPMKVYKKNGDWIIKQTVKNEISKIEYEGGNQISFNGFPYNWPQNGTWKFSQDGSQCQIDHVEGGRVMRWSCPTETQLETPQQSATTITTSPEVSEAAMQEKTQTTVEAKHEVVENAPAVNELVTDEVSEEKSATVKTSDLSNQAMPMIQPTKSERQVKQQTAKDLSNFKMGQESYNVEKRAEQLGCQRTSIAYFTGKDGFRENYYVECSNQPAMKFQCDMGQCQPE